MFKYNYYRANTIGEVCTQLALQKEKVRIIAGGTDIMVQIREKEAKWKEIECLLDITSLGRELRYITEAQECIRIGALSTHTDIETSKLIKKFLPFLSEACASVGSPQIRNLGTIGGSICNASVAADPLSPLIAADTQVVIQGVQGAREVDLKSFYTGRGTVDLQEGEFVTEFIVKKLTQGAQTAFIKLGRRKALAISRMNVSAVLGINGQGVITEARIAPGCIFVKPDRVTEVEALLLGNAPSGELFASVGKAVSEEMITRTGIRWSTEYKKPAIEGLVEDALYKAAGMEAV